MISERDVTVNAPPGRDLGDRPRDRLPGLGGLDDLIDNAERDRPRQPSRLALVLSGELGLELVALVGGRGGEPAPGQDPDPGDPRPPPPSLVGHANTRVAPSAREFIAM